MARYEVCWTRALAQFKALRVAASKTVGCRRYEAIGGYVELTIGEMKAKVRERSARGRAKPK